ncbi:MAG: hypothetical protein M3033_17605, partial [Acidobacteriota bacterium]|nr:hypothetical protein [Acidobacteriota bacterium]
MMQRIKNLTNRIGLLACLLLCLTASAAMGATLIVDNTTDNAALTACTSAPNDCSLRGAIAAAAPGDTVTFDSGLFMTPRLIRLNGTELLINKNLTVTGVGGVIIDGNNASGVFISNAPGPITVNLSGMTVTGGRPAIPGGGIECNGTLTLTNMTVTGNVANAGGGIFQESGTLNIVNSTISDNSSFGSGGGIFAGTMNMTGST